MRKLRYLGEPSNFVAQLIETNHRDSASLIRETLLEVCRAGKIHSAVQKAGDKENMYRVRSLPGDSDGLLHPGYEAIFLLLEQAVLVLEIRPLSLD
ncbi:MAG: hypothetical protein RRB13_02505 [bacterium]|nr:hypothetical protein [bacterium]